MEVKFHLNGDPDRPTDEPPGWERLRDILDRGLVDYAEISFLLGQLTGKCPEHQDLAIKVMAMVNATWEAQQLVAEMDDW